MNQYQKHVLFETFLKDYVLKNSSTSMIKNNPKTIILIISLEKKLLLEYPPLFLDLSDLVAWVFDWLNFMLQGS